MSTIEFGDFAMRRAAFLILTGLTQAKYQNRAQSINSGPLGGVGDPVQNWSEYSSLDVLKTCLEVALVAHVGSYLEAYKRVFEIPSGVLEPHFETLCDLESPDVWALSFKPNFPPNSGSELPLKRPYGWSFGELSAVHDLPSTLEDRDGKRYPATAYAQFCDDMVSINLSKIVREIVARGKAAGLIFTLGENGEPLE